MIDRIRVWAMGVYQSIAPDLRRDYALLVAVLLFVQWAARHVSADAVTAAMNGAWGSVGLAIALLAHCVLRQHSDLVTPTAKEVLAGARIAGTCLFLHRMGWWNVALWTAPHCAQPGPKCSAYAQWAFDERWIPAMLVVGICYGGLRATRPLASRVLGPHCGAWTALYVGGFAIGSGLLALL